MSSRKIHFGELRKDFASCDTANDSLCSAALHGGIGLGDQILAVNGESVQGRSLAEVCRSYQTDSLHYSHPKL